MRQIDQDPRRHSHLYEVKPISRWWFALAVLMGLVFAYGNGLEKPTTWVLLFCGALVAAFAVLCFPRHWLSKTRD
jgi:hypothetical protein